MTSQLPQQIVAASPSPATLDRRNWIAGLEKGLSIIEGFDDANPRLTASNQLGRSIDSGTR